MEAAPKAKRTPPRDAQVWKGTVAAEKLLPSARVYETLTHCKSLVPGDNQAFREFALRWWGKQPSVKGFITERHHGRQWEDFDEQTSARIRKAVQEIIDLYFPDGRPQDG